LEITTGTQQAGSSNLDNYIEDLGVTGWEKNTEGGRKIQKEVEVR